MANTHLTRTSGTSTNTDIFTISTWVKRSELDDNDFFVYATGGNSDDNWFQVGFANDNKFIISAYNTVWLKTNRVFRDVNAWYHIVIKADSPQGTASNRLKLYVNGVEETSFTTDNRSSISQGQTWGWNKNSIVHYIGSKAGSNYFDGCLSHFHFSDGYAYDASTFGSTDSTTGEWKINADPSFTLGTNGFTILKDGNTITDQSTNSNNWTLAGGTLTKTEDCPSNVFCTMNPLDNYYAGSTFSNGNTTVATATSPYTYNTGNMGMSSGKYYWELKWLSVGSGNSAAGIISTVSTGTDDEAPTSTDAAVYKDDGVTRENGSNGTSIGAVSANDIVSFAYDADNNFIYFALNGTWQNSGDPTSGASGTGGYDPGNTPANTTTGNYFPFFSDHNGGGGYSASFNFGNGYFGTTAVSSAGTNASGNGIFEYDVPAGYTALSTKGLNL